MADAPSFADLLRVAREKSGQTQATLAEKCRLTGSYISLLESGKKPAPSDRVVRRLAAALGLDVEEALQVAHLDRAPEDLRRALDRLRSQAAREKDLRERTAEALFPLSIWNLLPSTLPRRARNAVGPNLDTDIVEAIDHLWAVARSTPDFSSLQAETRRLLGRLPVERRRRFLDAVPALVDGAAVEGGLRFLAAPEPGLPPEIRPGDTLVVDRTLVPAAGDAVLVEEAGKVLVLRWEPGAKGVLGVVVEVRKRMR